MGPYLEDFVEYWDYGWKQRMAEAICARDWLAVIDVYDEMTTFFPEDT